MSYKRAAGASKLVERRNEWVASLRESLPAFAETSASPLQRGSEAAILGDTQRHALSDAMGSGLLALPPGWVDEVTRRLSMTLHSVVPSEQLRQNDYFLCSLIHPTYVRAETVPCDGEARRRKVQQQLRRTVCMPLELTAAGSKSLRLFREVNVFLNSNATPSSPPSFIRSSSSRGGGETAGSRAKSMTAAPPLNAPWPELAQVDMQALLAAFQMAELEPLVLYDRQAFPSPPVKAAVETVATPPREVSMTAVTALCGSIELGCGWSSLVAYVDRVAREHSKRGAGHMM